MKKTGEILRTAREKKGLTLNEVGLSLKINNKVLRAIEEGDEANLPAKTFLRGFVQSYANLLQLNSDEIMKVFHEERGSTKPKPYIALVPNQASDASGSHSLLPESEVEPSHATSKAAENKNNDSLKSLHQEKNSKTIWITIVSAILLGLIVFTKKMIDKYSKEAEIPVAEIQQVINGATPVTPDVMNATAEVPNPNQTLLTSSNPTGAVNAPPASSTTNAAASVKPTTDSTTPTSTPPPAASAKPEPTETQNPIGPPSTEKPQVVKPPDEKKPVELIVEALDAVEIEYNAPNGKPQKIKLAADQVHTFKSKSGLTIHFSNGGAVNLIQNGKEIGVPGDLGKPIKLSY